jgi:G6PDH family F420-dependent oxidoreductase
MVELGYALSSEEHDAKTLVRNAQKAEEAGFEFAMVSDHYHPWLDLQGQSPFVWSVIGGISQVTSKLRLGTGVTCPTMRIHPAIIAQASATAAHMMDGRFFLGVGSGENLNEHIIAKRWPPPRVRLEMLREAIEVIRKLWKGGMQSHYGKHYTVEDARIYTLPEEPIDLMVAATGPVSTTLAGEMGDGLIGTSPEKEMVQKFEETGGEGKPKYGQIGVCWAEEYGEAVETARKWWPTSVMGSAGSDLALPSHFAEIAELVKKEDIAKSIICGPDAEKYVEEIRKFIDAGFDHIYLHQVGPDQEGFLRFFQREILPEFSRVEARSGG